MTKWFLGKFPVAGVAIIAVALGGGCTTTAVREMSASHAQQMIDFQYQQIVDNLARFVWDENSLPSNVTISSGIAQVSDRISPGIQVPFNTTVNQQVSGSATAERQWTVNWNVRPVVEGDSLVALQNLYRDQVRWNIPEGQRNLGRKGKEVA